MGILSRLFKNSSVQVTPWEMPIVTSSGIEVTTDGALNLSSIYACINVKSNGVAKLPLQVFKKTDNGSERVTNHPVVRLLETRPNPYQTPYQFKHTVQVHRNTYGIAYIRMNFDNRGQVNGLYIIHPQSVTVGVDSKGTRCYIEDTGNRDNPNIYYEDEIIRLPYLSLDGGITPKSPLTILKEQIGLMKRQTEFVSSFYANGTLTRGVLKLPGILNKEAKDKIRQAWADHTSGSDNMSKVAVLDNGIDFQNITIPLESAQWIQTIKFNIEEVSRAFNVPLHMINSLDHATYSNIEMQSMEFIQNTIQPEIVAWEEELTYKLFTELEISQGYYVKFNLSSALRADSTARANYYKTMIEMGVYSINEVRDLEEKGKIEHGDDNLISLNYAPLKMLEELKRNQSTGGGE